MGKDEAKGGKADAKEKRTEIKAEKGAVKKEDSDETANVVMGGRLDDRRASWAAGQLAAVEQEREDRASAAALQAAERSTAAALQPQKGDSGLKDMLPCTTGRAIPMPSFRVVEVGDDD